MKGYRNTTIAIAFMLSCLGVVWMTVNAGQSVAECATTIAAMAVGTGGAIFGRALNKKHENGAA